MPHNPYTVVALTLPSFIFIRHCIGNDSVSGDCLPALYKAISTLESPSRTEESLFSTDKS